MLLAVGLTDILIDRNFKWMSDPRNIKLGSLTGFIIQVGWGTDMMEKDHFILMGMQT